MNYPDIKWETCTNSSNKEDKEFMFIEPFRDSFLSQLINKPTTARGPNKPLILDLVLINDEYTIKTITYDAPLGKRAYCNLRNATKFIGVISTFIYQDVTKST